MRLFILTTALVLTSLSGLACKHGNAIADDPAATANKAGLDAFAKGDYDGAITQYDKAVALKPTYAEAFKNRGVAFERKEDYDHAISDFDKAIEIDPKFAGAFSNRGFTHQLKGETPLAIKDFDSALAIKPNMANALINRGRAEFYLGDFAKAEADLRQGYHTDSSNAYTAIWLHIAAARQGKNDAAEFATNSARGDSAMWPAPIARFYLGKLSADQLLAASAATNSKTRADQRCAAAFYVGESALWRKDNAQAATRLRETRASCPKMWTEYQGAVAELQRLGVK